MTAIQVPSPMLAAAMIFAAKSDVRYYLNGVRVNNDRVSATNGHIAFDHKMSDKSGAEKDIILAIKRTIPARAHFTRITLLDDKTAKLEHVDGSGFQVGLDICELIDGKYPDFDLLMKRFEKDQEPVMDATFNLSYLELASRAIKRINRRWNSGTIRFFGENSAVRIDSKHADFGLASIVIMPMRA